MQATLRQGPLPQTTEPMMSQHRELSSSPSAQIPVIHRGNAGQLLQLQPRMISDRLQQSGALLLRGFSSTLVEFQLFTESLCEHFHQVGTRRAVEDPRSDGHTSEVPSRNFNLFVHSEGAYRPFPPPPELCFFNCVVPPSCAGGETLLVDGVRFLEKLPAEARLRFAEQGVIYQALWDSQRWQTEFQVDSLEQLNDQLALHPQCSYHLQEDAMCVRCQMPAIQQTLGGLDAFANGLLAHLPAISHPRWQSQNTYSRPTNQVFFGDGEPISTAVINALIDIQDEIALAHAWQPDDLLILDNTRFMHGRRTTIGDCERQIRSRFGWLKADFKNQAGKELKA
jgi:alpha-ketoglutarate-dependent taurine dioxygenase